MGQFPTETPFTFDGLYESFARRCAVAWDVGLELNGRPGRLTSITLPEGVFPGVSQFLNPVDRSLVPVVRVPLFAVEYPKAVT